MSLLDRVSVLLNRVDKGTGLSLRDIEGILGLPVRVTVPSDERSIRDAVEEGIGVNPKSVLGAQIQVIARKMAGSVNGPTPPRPKRKFVEFFSVPQSKGLDPWRL